MHFYFGLRVMGRVMDNKAFDIAADRRQTRNNRKPLIRCACVAKPL